MKHDDFIFSYSEDGLLNRVLFLSELNDINFFVEDSNKEYEYEIIFERIFGTEFNINCIFPVGGKPKLQEAFECFGSDEAEKNYGVSFFIADGDFDKVLELSMIEDDKFIYLEHYNIENYYFDKNTIINYMRCCLKKTRKEVEAILNYDLWYRRITSEYKKLFLLYIVVKKYCPQLPNVARGAYKFIDNNTGFGDFNKYNDYVLEVSNYISDIDEKISEIKIKINSLYESDFSRVICGKHYLESLLCYLRSFATNSVKYDAFKAYLLNNFDISKLNYFKERVSSYISTHC